MRDEPQPAASQDKTPHDKFKELGSKLMRVPKTKVDAREKAWQAERKPTRKRR